MGDAFFGLQLALDLPGGDPRRDDLTQMVADLHGCTAIAAQRRGWSRAAAAMQPCLPCARLGTWDLIRSGARESFSEWKDGLEAMAGWSDEDCGPAGTYLLMSVTMLVIGNSNSDQTLGDICDIPEPRWHHRATYARLVDALTRLNFASVRESALYLAPHPGYAGFDRALLVGDGFTYLRAIDA